MGAATQSNDVHPAPETAKAERGFTGLQCVYCGEKDTISVDLESLEMTCSACENEFTAADVEEVLAAWGKVLAWLELAPAKS